VDNMATGLGALLVLVLIGAGAAYQHLSLLSLGLIALWVVLVLHGRGAYVGAFRQALEERMIDVGEFTVDITEASTIDSLVGSLASDNERHVVYALDMLASTRAGRLIEPVRQLLRHNSIEVRQKALLILQNQEDGVPLAEVEELLQDDNLEVRIEALYYLCLKGEGERLQRLQEALRSPDRKLRTAAVGCIAGYGTAAENDLVDAGFIQGLYADSDEEGMSAAERVGERIQAAKLLGNLERPGMRPYLRQFMRQLMEDPEPEVVQQTIISLGQLGDLEHVPWLLDKLAQRNYRMVSRQALAAYGTGVLEPLGRYLVDEHMELMVRGHIPRVLSSIVEQDSVDLLISSFAQVDPMLEYALIKALSKLRGQNPGLGFDEVWVDAVLQEEIKSCYAMLQALQVYQNADDTTAVQLLKKALREKQEQNVERTFRLLGLQYAPQDMYNAYLGFVSGQRATRASAIEFLDNVLRWKIKEQLIPLLDPLSPDSAIPQGEQLFGFSMSSRKEVLEYLLASRDAWLRTCAVYSVAEENAAAQVELLREAQDDPHPVVRETAALVLRGATS
jgi:AAA family ATP:ADP antiporter